MSHLREEIPAALLRGLITWLLALAMGLPLLAASGLPFLISRYALISLCVSALCCLLSLRRFLLPGALIAATILQAALLIFGKGFFEQTIQLLRAFVLLIRDAPLAVKLHADALCVQLAVLLSLFCYVMSSPDVDVLLPITVFAGLLGGQWMLGQRQATLYMLPALPALLLMCAYTHSYVSLPDSPSPRPTALVVPLAAALLGAALLTAPKDGTTIPVLARLAEDIKETINDRFFFQQQRSRYSLADDGWMPLGDHQLGGEPEPSDQLIMEVETDETVYLRGSILDAYTGAYWYDSISSRRYYWNSTLQRSRRDEIFQADYPLNAALEEKQLSVSFAASGSSTLFVPQRIRSLETGKHMTPYFNLGSEVFITRNLRGGDTYTLSYLPTHADDKGIKELAESLALAADPRYPAAVNQYTALPDHIQEEVYSLAASITSGCTSAWQKATAIRDYLHNTYPYSLDVEAPPRDVDFVAWFLLGEKKGYCTYFASAMTVLCRMAGLPARYIEGYVANAAPSGISAVRGYNAHAWTEVYLNGVGWVTFDATPGYGKGSSSGAPPPSGGSWTPTPTPPQASPSPSPSPSPTPESEPENQSRNPDEPTPTPSPSPTPSPLPEIPEADPPQEKGSRFPWWWLLLALAAIALLAWRIRTTEPLRRAAHLPDQAALLLLWQSALQCTRWLKLPIRSDETPLSYAARAETALRIPLLPFANAISALEYGRHTPRRTSLNAAKDAYARLLQRLNPLQRAALALRRALLPQKKAV